MAWSIRRRSFFDYRPGIDFFFPHIVLVCGGDLMVVGMWGAHIMYIFHRDLKMYFLIHMIYIDYKKHFFSMIKKYFL